MKKCQSCNFQNDDKAVYCSNCGKKLKKINNEKRKNNIESICFLLIWIGIYSLCAWGIGEVLIEPIFTQLGMEEGGTWSFWIALIMLILIGIYRK